MPATVDVIAETLRSAGVRYAFGLPGGEVIDLIEAFRRVGIEFLLVGHEFSAAVMADVTAQLTGTPGVCVGTVGPGAVNMLPGVAHAYLDRGPVLAFTGRFPAGHAPVYTHQALDQQALYRPVVKWSAELGSAAPQESIRKAIRIACSGRPGPVHLDLATDVALREAPVDPRLPPLTRPELDAGAPAGAVAAAAALIAAARRPALVVGLGCLWDGVGGEVAELARRLGAPVLVTPKAKGVLPESDPHFLGVIGLGMRTDRTLKAVLAEADLVVSIGFDPVEVVRSWYRPWPTDRPAVHIDRLPNVDEYYRSDQELVGNVRETLRALLSRLPDGGHRSWRDWPEERRRLVDELLEARSPQSGSLSPAAVIMAARKAFTSDATCVVDVGAHKILAGQLWRTDRPNGLLLSNGLSIMGYAVPAAIAARLSRPESPVLAIVGDGGFAMSMQELELAVRRHLPVTFMVLRDQALSLIKLKQERKGYEPAGVDFHGIDMAAFARAAGAAGLRVESMAHLEEAIAWAAGASGPVVLEVPVDAFEYRRQLAE